MKQTTCYLSGKISGLEKDIYERNFIIAMRDVLKVTLFNIDYLILPTEIKPLFGIHSYWCHMAADIFQELKCTHVAFQKNWIDSKWARIEMIVAILFNKKIIML